MAFIEWKAEYSVGSLVLDQQHKALIALINKLHETMLKGALKDDMRRVFSDLVIYTESHFKCEEGMMWEADYPQLAAHHLEHMEFVRTARDLQAQLLAGKFMVSMDLLRFLRSWLSEHILGSDQQYAPFLSAARSTVASGV